MRLAHSYEVIRRLARGSTAEICLAHRKSKLEADTLVVLKRLLPEMTKDRQRTEAFLTEARVTAQVAHPSIVAVEAIDVGDHYYYVMEYVRGADLYHVMQACGKRGRLVPLVVSIEIAIALCEALDHAHERRIDLVHGHICPSKVLLSDEGAIKLAGFGIAPDERTHGYQSPEQCAGRPLDRRSDVFSVGMLLYELTTGTRLLTSSDPQPSKHSGYPMLAAIVTRALRQDPADRYQTAAELAADLVEFLEVEQLSRAPSAVGELVATVVRAPEPPPPPETRDSGTLPPLTSSSVVVPQVTTWQQRWGALAALGLIIAGIGISMIAAYRNQYEPAPPLYVGKPAPPEASRTTIRPPRIASQAARSAPPTAPVEHAPMRKVVAQAPSPPPPSVEATIAVASLDVRGSLAVPVVRKAIDGALPALRGCYHDAARASGGRATSIEVMFDISRSRAPSNLRASVAPPFGSLQACATKALAAMRTAKAPDGGKARVYLTVSFRPV